MRDEIDCAHVRDLIPELAAGVAPGDVRADALGHIAGCAGCRAELASAATVVDDLLLLVPAHEPSPGFESRVLAALPHPVRRHRRAATLRTPALRRAALRVAAAVVAVALVAGLAAAATWSATADDRRLAAQYRQTLAVADGRYLVAAPLTTSTGTGAGHAFAYEGNPSWVFVTVTTTPASGVYTLRILTDDGRSIDTGTVCTPTSGTAGCGAATGIPIRTIRQIQLQAHDAPPLTADLS